MTLINQLYVRFRHLILYGIIGCCSSGLDFAIFTVLENLGLHYIAANCISVLAGIITSFTLNRKYNFKVTDKTARRFAIFLTVGLCGLIMSNIILYLCIDVLCMDKLVSKLLSILLVVLLQFLINKHITFKIKK